MIASVIRLGRTGCESSALKSALEQPSFALVSLVARYEFNPALSLQLNIENLFDKRFYSQIGVYDQLAYGPPRNVPLLMNYNFR